MQTDLDLINKVKTENCQESLLELTKRHKGLCFSISKKYSPLSFVYSGFSLRELVEGNIELLVYEAAKGFKEDMGTKFSTHLGNQIRYLWLNAINKNARLVTKDSKEINFLMDTHQPEIEDTDILEQMRIIMKLLNGASDKRVLKIFKLRYFSKRKKDRIWENIGKKVGLTRQGALNIHNRFLKFLKLKLCK